MKTVYPKLKQLVARCNSTEALHRSDLGECEAEVLALFDVILPLVELSRTSSAFTLDDLKSLAAVEWQSLKDVLSGVSSWNTVLRALQLLYECNDITHNLASRMMDINEAVLLLEKKHPVDQPVISNEDILQELLPPSLRERTPEVMLKIYDVMDKIQRQLAPMLAQRLRALHEEDAEEPSREEVYRIDPELAAALS